MTFIHRHRHALIWSAALACFALGSWVGWTINANVGAYLWLAAAVLAFLPFLSHRHDDR